MMDTRCEKKKKRKQAIELPDDCREVLLHACCAPCSSAIVEWLMQHDVRPTIFYFNPNIYPLEEYETRKNDSKRHAEGVGSGWIDADCDRRRWLDHVRGHESAPERGSRCGLCFRLRLLETAKEAQRLGIKYFATTLASSRWKSLEQIALAGEAAAAAVSTPSSQVVFWAQNWRKGGLQDRRNQLLRQYSFYNQLYCGCEFSMK